MSATTIVGIVIVALAVVGVLVWYAVSRRQQREMLQAQYGSEYDRAVSHAESRHAAEAELIKRQQRVEKLEIRPLTEAQRELFGQQWHDVQEMFVDNPGGAVNRADGLVVEVMRTRGYPVANFEQRAADLSVNHAVFVENYRAARDIAERYRRNTATTEELRRAMVYYRELFEDLLETDDGVPTDRPVERVVERDVAPAADRDVVRPIDRDRLRADGRGERPVAPPSDREVR